MKFPHKELFMTHPLEISNNHLFGIIDAQRWLIDTGAPSSFGDHRSLTVGGRPFEIPDNYMGLTATQLTEHLKVPCAGLLGMDVLGAFAHTFDLRRMVWEMSESSDQACEGQAIGLDAFMSIPILDVTIENRHYKLFFDTGAQISYLEEEILNSFPQTGTMDDFFPGFGAFKTTVYDVEFILGGKTYRQTFGKLPALLEVTLTMASVQGVLGVGVCKQKRVAFDPKKGLLCLT